MINPSTLKVPSLADSKPVSFKFDAKGSMLTLSNGVTVREALYNAVFNQVMKRHSYLKQGVAYTAKQICGISFWLGEISPGDRNFAGICLHELVKLRRVPFIVAETAHEYPKEYIAVSR